MGWSYRKSFGSGPFRVNFSKSGISYSVGVNGARVNVAPRGTYVNLSSHGISYRRKIQGAGQPGQPYAQSHMQTLPVAAEKVHTIASANIEQLTDTDSKDFISELTQKSGQIAYINWFGTFPLILFLLVMLFTSFSSNTIITQPATDSTLVRVTSDIGANIRKTADAKSAILKAAGSGQVFLLADSGSQKWLKIKFNDATGYINRRFAVIERIHYDEVKDSQTTLANPYAGYVLGAGLIVFFILFRWLKKLDQRRFEMELHYEMDEQSQQVYQQLGSHFSSFAGSARIWQYLNAQHTSDIKRNAGASQLIKRTAIRGISGNQVPIRYFITNVAIPCLKLNNLEFYFLPERMLIKRGNTFAAVFYRNLRISGNITRFIEEEAVPGDAKVVDRTWRYVNKSGGPDRRFNNNRQLPICAYSQYTLTSDTGVYEVIATSKQGAMDNFAGFLQQIGDLQSKMAIG